MANSFVGLTILIGLLLPICSGQIYNYPVKKGVIVVDKSEDAADSGSVREAREFGKLVNPNFIPLEKRQVVELNEQDDKDEPAELSYIEINEDQDVTKRMVELPEKRAAAAEAKPKKDPAKAAKKPSKKTSKGKGRGCGRRGGHGKGRHFGHEHGKGKGHQHQHKEKAEKKQKEEESNESSASDSSSSEEKSNSKESKEETPSRKKRLVESEIEPSDGLDDRMTLGQLKRFIKSVRESHQDIHLYRRKK